MSLAGHTMIRVAWTFGSFLIERTMGLLVTVVLARILAPDSFAVIAAATLVATIIDTVREFGIREALVQNDTALEETADTGFYIGLGAGLLQAVLLLALAPLGTFLVSDPAIVDMLRLMAFVFPITALGGVHDALLSKQLRFVAKAAGDVTAAVVKLAVVGLLLALDVGIWSFAFGLLAGAAVRTLARWIACSWRPRFRFAVDRAKALLRFGFHVMAVSLVEPIMDRTDQFAVAFLLGDTQLAFYVIALRLPELLISSASMVFSRVLFPTFVKLNGDIEALTAAFLRATRVNLIVLAPIALGLAVVSNDLLPLLFGTEWSPAVPVLQATCIGFLSISAAWFTGDVFKARGRPEWTSRRTVIEVSFTVPTVWVTTILLRDMTATAIAMASCLFIASAIRVILTLIDLKLPVRRFAGAIAGSLGAAAGMVLTVWLVRMALPEMGLLVTTAISVVTGVIAYGGLILLLERREILDLWMSVRTVIADRGRSSIDSAAVKES